MPDPIKPTQADRDAAEKFIRSCDLSTLERYEAHTAQAFAHHAQQARVQALEEAGRFLSEYARGFLAMIPPNHREAQAVLAARDEMSRALKEQLT